MQNQVGRGITWSWATLSGFVLIYLLTMPRLARSEDAESSAGPFHPECAAAFSNLPVNKYGEAIEISSSGKLSLVKEFFGMEDHYKKHSEQYKLYDDKCFAKWGDLKPWTRDFLSNNAGVLFVDAPEGLIPKCSAFRFAEHFIVTAAHCLPGLPLVFRLFGSPHDSIAVELPDINTFPDNVNDLGTPGVDTEDFAILRIGNVPLHFTWTQDSFSRDTLPQQAIVVVSISIPAFYLSLGGKVENWLSAVRFSRVYASQLNSSDKMEPPLNDPLLKEECLFHRSPTFGGMSGAPIVAVRRPDKPEAAPKFLVVGIHLRNGPLDERDSTFSSLDKSHFCGDYPLFNVGIRIPTTVMQRVGKD